jgi:glycosyltransferase involved in cell wall biosynthesis
VKPKVLLAGTFDPEFTRNRVLVSLLERAGCEVSTVHRELWGRERYTLINASKGRLAAKAAAAYPALIARLAVTSRPDVILVTYPGYFDIPFIAPLARLRRIPLLFDPFISLYDTLVDDRGLRGSGSAMGRVSRLLDRVDCRLARMVLADTPAHADYFADATGVARNRFRVLWLGAREDVFHPVADVEPTSNLVVFHGTFIGLQGLPTIVRAAKLLEPDGTRIKIIGDGQERPSIEALIRELDVRNVELAGRKPIDQLAPQIAAASLCLGIFGTSAKAGRVVPNKLFECLAVGRPVVTGDTPAIRGAFSGEVEVVPPGDPEALAQKIRELLADPARLARLAAAGKARYERDYSESALSELLGGYVRELLPTA